MHFEIPIVLVDKKTVRNPLVCFLVQENKVVGMQIIRKSVSPPKHLFDGHFLRFPPWIIACQRIRDPLEFGFMAPVLLAIVIHLSSLGGIEQRPAGSFSPGHPCRPTPCPATDPSRRSTRKVICTYSKAQSTAEP